MSIEQSRTDRELARLVAARLTGKMVVPVAVGRMDANGRTFIPLGMIDVEGDVVERTGALFLVTPSVEVPVDTHCQVTAVAVFHNTKWHAQGLPYMIPVTAGGTARVVAKTLLLNFGDF